MKKQTQVTLSTEIDSPHSLEELAEFLFMFRAAYGTAFAYCREHNLMSSDQEEIEAHSNDLIRFAKIQLPSQLQARFDEDLGIDSLRAKSINQNSPLTIVFECVLPALALAVILSGGEFSAWGLKCRVNALGDGISKLRKALGLSGTVKAGFGIRSSRIKLNKQEHEELLKQDPSQKNKGGFQLFLVSIQNRVNKTTREIELSEADLEKIMRYKSNPNKGGWQSRFKKIFSRHFP